MENNNAHQLVVIGGGVAGIELVTVLGRHWRKQKQHVEVTLIDNAVAHVWKPMLHTLAAGTHRASLQQTSFLLHANKAGYQFKQGAITALNRENQEITISAVQAADGRVMIPERKIHYDTLILAIGSQTNDYGTPGIKEYCHSIDSTALAQAFHEELRVQFFQSLALNKKLNIAVVGGGATGVELCAELIEFLKAADQLENQSASQNFSITLIESSAKLLAPFPEEISAATLKKLESLGITVRLNAQVKEATQAGYLLADGELIASELKVWAAGVKTDEITKQFDGLALDRNNQIILKPTLQSTTDPKIFAVGDCSSLKLEQNARPFPTTAQVAHQQAQHLTKHLPQYITHQQPIPDFKYRDFGSIVELGNYEAYASLGKFGFLKHATIKGKLAQLAHAMLYRSHQMMIYGFFQGNILWLADALVSKANPEINVD